MSNHVVTPVTSEGAMLMRTMVVFAAVLTGVLATAGCTSSSGDTNPGSSYSTMPTPFGENAIQAQEDKIWNAVDGRGGMVELGMDRKTRVFEARVIRTEATPEVLSILKGYGVKVILIDRSQSPTPAETQVKP